MKIRFSKIGFTDEYFYGRYYVVQDLVNNASYEYGDKVVTWLYGPNNSEPLTIDDETWTVVDE